MKSCGLANNERFHAIMEIEILEIIEYFISISVDVDDHLKIVGWLEELYLVKVLITLVATSAIVAYICHWLYAFGSFKSHIKLFCDNIYAS